MIECLSSLLKAIGHDCLEVDDWVQPVLAIKRFGTRGKYTNTPA